MQLTDTHAHVQMRQFARDRDEMLSRVFAAGVSRIICPGVDPETSRDGFALAERYRGKIYATAGVHPHDSAGFDDGTLAAIRQLCSRPDCPAVGEIGLDYYRNLSPVADQRQAFAAQVALARELDKPIIVHNRDAHADIMNELRPYGTVKGIWHCFIGDQAMAEEGLGLGMYLSIAGPVTYPANQTLRDTVALIPLDRLLIETDSPYLTPHPHRRDRNDPAQVRKMAETIATVRDMAVEDLVAATSANAARVFGLPPLADTMDYQ